jgi:hypothetical protein
MHTKKELFGIEIGAYLGASKGKKGEILDTLVRQTGMWRESIIRSFKRLQMQSALYRPKKRGRRAYYTAAEYDALKEVWSAANGCCGELLHPVIPEYVAIFKRDGMWAHSELVTGKLRAMSMATVKRAVSGWKCEGRRGISTTTPSAIKSRVPIFEGSWHEVPVGMGQIDTVAHCGGSLTGDFVFACGYVDVTSGWIQYTAQWNKGMEATKESLAHIRTALPFDLVHIHPDCGTEFLNQIVMGWCEKERIAVSRSRSYHKNDNGYVEQRNGHIDRRWLGHARLGDRTLLSRLIAFYDLVCLYHNHFIAQRLCVGTKTLAGGRVRKVYENRGMTPYSRLLARRDVKTETKRQLRAKHRTLNPKTLHDMLTKEKCAILEANRRANGAELLH